MNGEDFLEAEAKNAKQPGRKNKEDVKSQSSKLGYLIIFACVLIVSTSLFVTQQIGARELPQPQDAPADTIKLSSLSTSWTCPISGSGENGDTLTLANSDTSRISHVDVSAFKADGKLAGKKSYEVNPSTEKTISVSEVGADSSTSLFVESFGSSIAVFRSLKLSDGPELISCINNLDSRADFPNLETIRNSNSTIVVANPFDEAIVIDITANLVDNSVNPPISVLDELRGVIIPSHGKTAVDLQSEFGRYPLVSAHLKSRSGFFAAETLVSFTGALSVNGQTVVSSARDISAGGSVTWVGASPTRITAYNESLNARSVSVTSIATDKRSMVAEPDLVSPGTTSVLSNLGADFSARTTIVEIEASSTRANNIFASWLHASGDSVSGGSFAIEKARRSLVPVTTGDELQVYNPNNKKVSFTISKLGSKATKVVTIDAKSYTVFSLENFEFSDVSVLELKSDRPIFVAASSLDLTRHVPGIEIRS